MTGSWQVGYNKSVVIGGVSLKIKTSSWDEEIASLDTTHSQSGGVYGAVYGILKGTGTITACVDADVVPPNLGIVPGATGAMFYTLGSLSPFVIPIGITKVHYASAVDGLVTYSFDCELNSEVGNYTRAS